MFSIFKFVTTGFLCTKNIFFILILRKEIFLVQVKSCHTQVGHCPEELPVDSRGTLVAYLLELVNTGSVYYFFGGMLPSVFTHAHPTERGSDMVQEYKRKNEKHCLVETGKGSTS